ncbi:hypothetical protein F4677DRAFT_431431 [Hypoxylon crocopeplum]|nr:hypothetical protein F4677DRAFT_431431 [Hypoxylon crocopeplum]
MEYPWESIVISILVLLGAVVVVVLCARWGGLCGNGGLWFGRRERRPKTSLPKSIQQALTQLEGVTEKRPNRNPQTESEEAECPICLAYLYPADVQASTSVVGNKADLEAGNGISRTTTTTTTDVTAEEKKRQRMQPVDDEVLKLKRCRHVFHARCLATWFLRKKYECPVCRTPYYQVVDDTDVEEDYRIPPTLPAVAFW